jgi:hypothetical protein
MPDIEDKQVNIMSDIRRDRNNSLQEKKTQRPLASEPKAAVIDYPSGTADPIPDLRDSIHNLKEIYASAQYLFDQWDARNQRLDSQLEQYKKAFAQMELLQKKLLYHFLVREHEARTQFSESRPLENPHSEESVTSAPLSLPRKQTTAAAGFSPQDLECLFREWSKWLWKQVGINVNGVDLEGILTEINSTYITIIAAETVYVIPFQQISFISRKS